MGYTHYWHNSTKIPFVKWDAFIKDAKKIVDACTVPLVYEHDEIKRGPEVGPNLVRLNGVGEDGHETFFFDWQAKAFTFCKTARKPYDTAVCAMLIAASHHFGKVIEISSDGDAEDWKDALAFTKEVLGYGELPFDTA